MSIKKATVLDADQSFIKQLNRHLNKQSSIAAAEWQKIADEYVWGDVAQEEAVIIEKIMQFDPFVSDTVLDASLRRDHECEIKIKELKQLYNFNEAKWNRLVQQYVAGSLSEKPANLVEVRAIYDDVFAEKISQEKLLHEAKDILGLNPKSGSVSSIQSEGPVRSKSRGIEKNGP